MTRRHARRAFSLVEMLIALTISATLLAATLAALDTSFKSYKVTTDSASTHVIARIVMQRVTAMVRTGEQFGPFPVNPILNPTVNSDWIEFLSDRDPATNTERITRLERREALDPNDGPFELWHVISTFQNGNLHSEEAVPLLQGLMELRFIMDYDVGPRLKRVTIDMVIRPNDMQDAAIAANLEAPTIRLVASASPRFEN